MRATSPVIPIREVPAKLAAPVVSRVIERPRLYEALTAGLECPVTLLAATAGWGKTLLTASWIAAGAGGREAAWISLDASDNDPRTFWGDVAAALLRVAAPEQAAALRAMATETDVDALPGIVASAAQLSERPIVLVLDNLHEVTSPEVHAGLLRLVERPLPSLAMLVATRHDPPWPLPRLRVSGLLAEVRTEALAFRPDEATAMFEQLKVDLSAEQVACLAARTEGWPAGLRLAALQLRDVGDAGNVEAAVAAFSGADHRVAEYVVSEVLGREAPELIAFLQKISAVEFVCAELADALTGRRDSAALLADLAASHLFVQAVDRPGQWYRLHRLVADVVRARPAAPRERREVHRRAAEWFRRHAMPFDAIGSATAGGMWRLTADLVATHLVALAMNGQARELERRLSAIPPVTVRSNPELAIGLAGARIVQGDDTEVAALVSAARAAKDGLPRRRAARLQVLIDLVAVGLARSHGDWGAATVFSHSVPVDAADLASLGIASAEIVPVIARNAMGTAALWRDDLAQAEHHLRAALEADLPIQPLAQLNAAAYRTLLLAERGELDGAEAAARAVIATAAAAGRAVMPQAVAAYLTMAQVALDRGTPDAADDWLGRIAEVLEVAPEPHVRVAAALLLAARHEDAGDPERALAALRAATAPLATWRPPPALRDRWVTAEAALVARLGDAAAARALLDQLRPPTTAVGWRGAARTLLAVGDAAAARAVRARIGPAAHERAAVETALLDARLAEAAGDAAAALEGMENALAVAAPWGLRRPFLVHGTALRPLLEQRIERGTVAPTFALGLLGQTSAQTPDEARHMLVDPLTAREQTVLRYLASSLSNGEIAAELYLSVNTVKTHQRAVYRKLGAGNRREAVRLARALHLL